MPKTRLTAVSRTQGNNRALKEGRVTLPDHDLTFEEVDPLPRAFRRMVREGAWDVSEMALTTYICARAHGAKLTGIPIFLVRDFHHGSMVRAARAEVAPKSLEGQRVGVARGYTVTTGVWAREILASDYGVDLTAVTWARSDVEHVADYVPPGNVEALGGSGAPEEQVERGDLVAAVGMPAKGTGWAPLIPDPAEAGLRAFRQRGLYPINHLVVIRDDVLANNSGLAGQLFEAFAASKRLYVEDLKAGRIADPTPIDRVHRTVMEEGLADPLPYGLAPNQRVLDMLMETAVAQGIIETRIPLESLFSEDTLNLVG